MAQARGRAIRRVAASVLVTVGVLLALIAGLSRYIDGHFHDPEVFVENTESLADDADVRERIFQGLRDEIITLADGDVVEEEASESDGLEELFGSTDDGEPDPITDARIERDLAIEAILLNALDSDLYRESFVASLSNVQTQVIRSAELEDSARLRDNGPVTFDMRRLYPPIYAALASDARTAEITQTEVPASYGIFSVADRETTTDFAWSMVRNGPRWRTLSLLGAVAALFAAVALADRRPSTIMQFGGGMLGLGALVFVFAWVVRALIPLLVESGSSAGPVSAVYAANVAPLTRSMMFLGATGLGLLVIGWIARMIWPDDWVLDHVTDSSGTRSVKRRQNAPAPVQQQAAAAPVPGYGYPPQGYGYPPAGWGQPYPQQWPPPGYGYPPGPYAQPAAAPQATAPQPTAPAGRPTVPVVPVDVGSAPQVVDDARPSDAAQAVPRVVASASEPSDDVADVEPAAMPTNGVSTGAASGDAASTNDVVVDRSDDWSTETDW